MLCRIGPSWWGQSVIMIFSFSSLPAHTVLYSQLYRSSLLYKSCLLYIRPLFSHFFRSRPSTQATPQYTATLLSLFSSFSYYRPCHNGIKGAGIRGRALEILLSPRPEPDLLPPLEAGDLRSRVVSRNQFCGRPGAFRPVFGIMGRNDCDARPVLQFEPVDSLH